MRWTRTWPLLPVAALGSIVGQILYAADRPDLPSYDNYETSGALGDPGKPGLTLVALGDSSITAPGVTRVDDAWIRKVAHGLTEPVFCASQGRGGGRLKSIRRDRRSTRTGPGAATRPCHRVGGGQRRHPGRAGQAVRAAGRGDRSGLDGPGGAGGRGGGRRCRFGAPSPPIPARQPTRRSAQFDRVSADVAARHAGVVKVDVRGDLSEAFRNDQYDVRRGSVPRIQLRARALRSPHFDRGGTRVCLACPARISRALK